MLTIQPSGLSNRTLINSLNNQDIKKVLVKWMIVEHNSNPEGQQSMREKERNIKGKKKKKRT